MNVQDISKYGRIVRKWWWVVVLLLVSTVGTMLAIAYFAETQYEATVTVQVSAPPPQEVPLYSSYGREALRDEIEWTRTSFQEFILEGDVPYRALEILPDVEMTGNDLRDRMTVDVPENSQLMRISVRASAPDTAARLANAVVEAGLGQYGQLLAQPTVNTRMFIERELEVARTELGSAERERTQFQIANKVGSLNSAINSQYEIVRSLRLQRDLSQAEGETSRAQAIDEAILERETELQNLIGLSTEYNELLDHVERVRATYNYLLDRRTEAQIKENQILELDSIQVITPARAPQRPVSAITAKVVVLGGVVSLLTGILLTFWLEHMEISGAFRSFQKLPDQSETTALSEKIGGQTASQ